LRGFWLGGREPVVVCFEELFPTKFTIHFVIPAKAGIQSSLVDRTPDMDWTPDVRSGVTENVRELYWDCEWNRMAPLASR